jgi:hypothetical protein
MLVPILAAVIVAALARGAVRLGRSLPRRNSDLGL